MTWTRETEGTPAEYREALRQETAVHGAAVIFDHSARTPEELNADVIELAWSLGWRFGKWDSDELNRRENQAVRRLMTVHHGDAEPDFLFPGATEHDVSENLGWVADDCEQWLSDHCAPDGFWIGNDGERGAFGCWPIEENRECAAGCGALLMEDQTNITTCTECGD